MSRILIAEDEPHIVRFLAKGLHAQGHSTASAPDGESALYMARTGEFDLMLLDLGLPKLDGSGVLTELRRLAEEVRRHKLSRTTLIVVGAAVGERRNRSRLYDKSHGHIFRGRERGEASPPA